MEKVYLIMVGEYSARHCVGFCTTEEEAIRYCALKNTHIISHWYGDEYEYEEQKCLDGVMHGHVSIGYSFKIIYMFGKNGWVRDYTSYGVLSVEHKPIVFEKDGMTKLCVSVWVKEDDEKKARKIAEDELYRYVYERTERDKNFAERLKKYIMK